MDCFPKKRTGCSVQLKALSLDPNLHFVSNGQECHREGTRQILFNAGYLPKRTAFTFSAVTLSRSLRLLSVG